MGNVRNMCQYIVVQYTMKNQKYVPVSSCTVHHEASDMCQYLVVQYSMKHHECVSVSSLTVHDDASEICASI